MEDQEIRDQYLENRQQNYVIDNMNAVAGCGGIGASDGSGEILGVKYDEQLQNEEHDVGDDDELKYVKEVQQSEKEQSVKDLGDYSSNELAENEEVKYKYEIGNGATGMGGIQDGENLMTSSNGHETHFVEDQQINDLEESIQPDVSVSVSAESLTSQEVASTGNLVKQPVLEDDEERSSLATNGTSSISENISNPLLNESEYAADVIMPTEQKNDGSNPLGFGAQSPLDLDLEQMHSQLNPDAKEFVPNFGSNPASPISPLPRDFQNLTTNDIVENKMYFGHTSSAVPRHITTDDDFVAQSPRKGRGDNMDTISLPAEQEFDEEADQRPHELEQDGIERLKVGLGNNTSDKTSDQTPTDELVSIENDVQCYGDFKDFQTSKTIDHGPETSVDISSQQFKDLSEIDNDAMRQSIYVSNDEPIEDVLNSVQPIPTEIDSTNNSATEELGTTDSVGDKELLQVEEKEHISNSPSTEDIQFHMQSTLDSSTTRIPLVSADMKEVATMQESFYLNQNVHLSPSDCVEEHQNKMLITDTTNPLVGDDNMLICSVKGGDAETIKSEKDISPSPDALSCGTFKTKGVREATTSSYKNENSTLEEYKVLKISSEESGLEQKMSEVTLNTDVLLPQTKEAAVSLAGTTNKNNSELANTADDVRKAEEVVKTNDENYSEFVNAPDDVGKACEQIPPRNEKNETQQLNQDTDEVAVTTNENNFEYLNTPDDVGKTDEVAASFAETTNDKQSEFSNTPGDIGKTESTTSLAGTTNENNSEFDVNEEYVQNKRDEIIGIQQFNPEGNNDLIVVEAPSIDINHTLQLFCTTNKAEVEVSAEDLLQANYSEDFKSVLPTMLSEEHVTSTFSLESHSPTASSTMLVKPEASTTEHVAIEENPLDKSVYEQKTTEDMSKNSHVDMYDIMSTNETENGTAVDIPLEKAENEHEDTYVNVQMNSNKEEQTDIMVDCSNNVTNAELVGASDVNAVVAPITTKIVSPSAAPKADDAKKASAKMTTNVAKAKEGHISNSTSKKTSATETNKKTVGIVAKPKLPMKSSTMPAPTDKKSCKQTLVSTTTARKVIGTSTTVTKTASKTTTTNSAIRSTSTTISATKTMTSRPLAATRTNISATGARKPPAPSSSAVAKPRPASGGTATSAKPTTLGVSGNNSSVKTKVTSPRATLTSQLRKTTPGPPGIKSPIKSTASNSVGKTAASSFGNRTKPATYLPGSGNTTATKQVSARPAIKPTISTSTTTTTTRRPTVGGATSTSTTSKTTNPTLRKSSPIKPTTGKTPPKSVNGNSVVKPKSAIKPIPPKSAVKETDLNGTTATSPVAFDVEDQQQMSLSQNAIIPSINDSPTQGRDGGTIDNMDLISA